MNSTGRVLTLCAGAVMIVWAFMSLASCSGPGAPEAKPKAPAPAPAPKSQPAKPAAQKQGGSDQWLSYGAAKDGSAVLYDSKSVERTPDGKVVKFWVKTSPPKESQVYTQGQGQVRSAGKDPRLLDSMKLYHHANCASMTYDITRVEYLDLDGKTLTSGPLDVRGRKPGPDMKGLMERLCGGAGQKATPGSSGLACERAGVMVLIQPEEAVQAGAQWRIEGKEWKNSGDAVCNLPVDEATQKRTYKIEYKPLPGSSFAAPEPHSATVSTDFRYSYYNSIYTPKTKDRKTR